MSTVVVIIGGGGGVRVNSTDPIQVVNEDEVKRDVNPQEDGEQGPVTVSITANASKTFGPGSVTIPPL